MLFRPKYYSHIFLLSYAICMYSRNSRKIIGGKKCNYLIGEFRISECACFFRWIFHNFFFITYLRYKHKVSIHVIFFSFQRYIFPRHNRMQSYHQKFGRLDSLDGTNGSMHRANQSTPQGSAG